MTDLTVSLYSKSSVCLFKSFTLLNTDNLRLALSDTSFICLFQFKSEVKTIPRCLWVLTTVQCLVPADC